MNARERLLAIGVVTVVILAGVALMFHQLFLSPYNQRKANLEVLAKQGQTKEARVLEILGQRAQLERYRQQSLPADIDTARREYSRYLDDLLRKSGFNNVSVAARNTGSRGVATLASKAPVFTQVTFAVSGDATEESLVKMLEGFYHTSLLHQIKTLTASRRLTSTQGQRRDELTVAMTIEALVVNGAEKRPTLMPSLDRRLAMADIVATWTGNPTGLGVTLWTAGPFGPQGPGILADPPRNYEAISTKNIFFGPPAAVTVQRTEPEVENLKYAFLTDITIDSSPGGRREANIYDRYANARSRLKTTPGFNQFTLLRSGNGATLIHGEVLRVTERDLVFRVGLNAKDPEDSSADYYTDREAIYHLHKNDVDALKREGLIRTDDADRVFWVEGGRWEALVKEKDVTVTGKRFAFRWGLVCGQVVRDDGKSVILRVDDKYCAYQYGEGGRRPRPHEGYCTLHVGATVAEALQNPLKEKEIKTLAAH